VSVYSAEPGGTYIRKDGTSMAAAPHVSGVAALMLSASSGDVSDDKLYDTLRNTANHPSNAADPDDRYGPELWTDSKPSLRSRATSSR